MLEKKPGAYIMIGNGVTGKAAARTSIRRSITSATQLQTAGARLLESTMNWQVELGDAGA